MAEKSTTNIREELKYLVMSLEIRLWGQAMNPMVDEPSGWTWDVMFTLREADLEAENILE